jgi:hypothetical protein
MEAILTPEPSSRSSPNLRKGEAQLKNFLFRQHGPTVVPSHAENEQDSLTHVHNYVAFQDRTRTE